MASTETAGSLFDSKLALYELKTGVVRMPKLEVQRDHCNAAECVVVHVLVAWLFAKLAAFQFSKVDEADIVAAYFGFVLSVLAHLLVDELDLGYPLVVAVVVEIQKDLKPKTPICCHLLIEYSLIDPLYYASF